MNKTSLLILLNWFTLLHLYAQREYDIFKELDRVVIEEESLLPVIDSADYYFTRDRNLSVDLYEYYYMLADRYPQWYSKGDTIRTYAAYVYNWHAFELLGEDLDLAERLVDTAYEISSTYNDSVTLMRSFYNYGTIARIKGENYKALDYFNQHAVYYLEPFDSVKISNVYYQIGAVYTNMGEYDKSIEYLLQCVRIDEGLGRSESNRWAFGALASNYRQLKQFDKALDYSNRTLTIFEELKDTVGVGRSLFNQSNIYADMDSMDRAINLQKRSIDLLETQKNRQFLATAYQNLGGTYLNLGQYNLAEDYLEKGYDIHLKYNEQRQITSSKTSLSKVKIKLGKTGEAVQLLTDVYAYAKENNESSQLSEITKLLSEAYEQMGAYKESLRYRKEHGSWQDSLFSKNMITSVNEADAKYQTERKEAEIRRLSLEDDLNQERISRQRLALGGATGGLGILSFLIYRIFGQKRQIESQHKTISSSLSEKETLLKEIHHRVKNNMQVISSLLRIQSNQTEDAGALEALKEGQSRVQSMSLIHQDLYQHDNLTGIFMPDYLEKLSRSVIETYQLNPDQIKIDIEVDDMTLDVDTVVPLGLIINELVTNSLKYAFPKNREGNMYISLTEQDDQLLLTVKDDGIGIIGDEQKKGFGSGLIKAFADKLDAELLTTEDEGLQVSLTINEYVKI